ncbi:MAG TPA: hypothetical protein VNH82_06320 [Candidatus Dormibacteraeota bacterium]|nr:hypothetical protein [Candidatus Dormibacteraeota bacterium]
MDREVLAIIDRHFLAPHSEFFSEIDRSIQPRRGRPLLSCRVLFAGFIYLGMVCSPKTVTKLARVLKNEATPGQLQLIVGTPTGPIHQHATPLAPSKWRIYRLYRALELGFKRDGLGKEIFGDDDLDAALRKVGTSLLDSSAPAPPEGAEYTVDTTDIWAACRPVSQAKLRNGVAASDPDARWRKKKHGKLDPDAPVPVRGPADKTKWEDKVVFGYGAVTVGGTHENYGYVYGCQLIPANQYGVLVSLKIADEVRARRHVIGALIGDREFGSAGRWIAGLRERDTMPAFDFKEDTRSRDADWKACLVLQGWPYLPQLPARLWQLERPGPQAPAWKWQAFWDKVDERQLYALLPHGRPTPSGARVTSPLFRNRALGCPKVPGSMRKRDPKLATCSGAHGDNEACCIRSASFKAEYAPLTYQYPVWGTPEWEHRYNKRTNVERGFSTLKNPDVIGMMPGLYRIRGLIKMSLLVACMFVAHNLHLRVVDEERLVKGRPRLVRTPRRHQIFARATLPAAPAAVSVQGADSRAP